MTQEKKPHVHAKLMKAYAEDWELKIEYQDHFSGEWYETDLPTWNKNLKYRIKPEPIKTERYRRWISKISKGDRFEYVLRIVCFGDYGVDTLHCNVHFVRWIDEDWQEGVVVGDSNDND